MYRGKNIFRCTQCSKIFVAPDWEYCATVYSAPQPCKRCGSIRTLPVYHILFKSFYKSIWEDMEKRKYE